MTPDLWGEDSRPWLHRLPGPAAPQAPGRAAQPPAHTVGGPASPTVVLIHGWNGHPRHWERIRAGLEQRGYRCLLPHLPERLGRRSIRDHAGDLNAFLQGQGVGGALVLAGYSQGGLAARALLRLRPALPVTGVFLVGTPNWGSPWGRLRLLEPLRAIFDMREGSEFLNWLNSDLRDLDRIPHLALCGRANEWEGPNDFMVWEASATMGGRIPVRIIDSLPGTDAWHGNLINRSWFKFPVPGLVASDQCWPQTLECLLQFLGQL